MGESINENFHKFQPVKVSPDKKTIVNGMMESPRSSIIQKHVQIQPIQSIQKDQNSPYDSHEEDESDEDEDDSVNMTETVRIPNGSSLLNFKSSD